MPAAVGIVQLPTICRLSSHSRANSVVLAGGCWRRARFGGVVARTAQRDEVEKADSSSGIKRSLIDDGGASKHKVINTSSGNSGTSSPPLPFQHTANLPVLACAPDNEAACLNIRTIDDPCLDDSLDRKVYEYMEQLLASGMTSERAAAVIKQWSSGGGAAMVDLRRLRMYFLRTTAQSVLLQHFPPVAALLTMTWLSYWSLGELPAADDALLHPALRGALVAVNLLLLVFFASGSLKRSGRLVRVGSAALDFSSRAELVLLALEDIASGHGDLIQAARGHSAGPAKAASSRLQRTPLLAVQRRAARQRVLDACSRVMQYVKRQAAASRGAAPALFPADGGKAGDVQETGRRGGGASAASSPLSSLDSFLVLQAAAATATAAAATSGRVVDGEQDGSGSERGFDAVSELGMSADEVTTAALMYARFGDHLRDHRVGDYELRRLLQEAGAPNLSEDERQLALISKSSDQRTWLTFRDWAKWWAATPAPADAGSAEVPVRNVASF